MPNQALKNVNRPLNRSNKTAVIIFAMITFLAILTTFTQQAQASMQSALLNELRNKNWDNEHHLNRVDEAIKDLEEVNPVNNQERELLVYILSRASGARDALVRANASKLLVSVIEKNQDQTTQSAFFNYVRVKWTTPDNDLYLENLITAAFVMKPVTADLSVSRTKFLVNASRSGTSAISQGANAALSGRYPFRYY